MRVVWGFWWRLLALVLLQLGLLHIAHAQQTGADFDHSSTGFVLNAQHQNVRCETCHTKGIFKGTPKTCEACHGWNNPRATTVMPTNHIPTRNAPCESCHAPNQSQFQDALRVFSHVSVAPQTCLNCHDSRNPHPGVVTNPPDAMHMAVLDNNTPCGKCHTSVQFTGPKMPANHIPTAAVPCVACHTNSDFSVMPSITAIHANAQSTTANCAQCHSTANAAAYAMPTMSPPLVGAPGNHIGMNGQGCETCHVGAGSSLTLPVVEGAKFSNSKFTHTGITSGCASCHGPGITGSSFAGISSIVVMPDSSSPGVRSHIPSSTNCEVCHAANMPSGFINPNATNTVPGSAFQLPKPTVTMVHAGVTSNCVACHDTNAQWLGMQLYPMAGYTGFQTRPQLAAGTFNVADAQHPQTGDCSDCHVGISFNPSAIQRPANHIPIATGAACGACHNTANFAQMPSIAAIHANAPAASMVSGATNCAQCHSSANATAYAMPTMVPAIVSPPAGHIAMGSLDCGACHVGSNSSLTLPVQNGANFGNAAFSHSGISSGCANCHGDGVTTGTFYGVVPKTKATLNPSHVPTALACETCHVNSVPATLVPLTGATSGTTFAGGRFSHSGISSGCETCHGASVGSGTFYGVTGIVTMPPTSPAGDLSHIPTSTTCENCHAGSVPSTLLSVTASHTLPGSGFQTAPPTAAQIHGGTSASCNSCHEAGMSWLGMTAYPRVPSVLNSSNPNQLYTGFHTRPQTAAAGFSLADSAHPATGDCAQCHGNTVAFGGPAMPTNHIPYAASATCSACHGDFSALPTVSAIHANIQSTSTGCDQCHSTPNAALYGAGMRNGVGIVTLPAKHISTGTLGCEGCHVGANSSIATTPVPDGARFSGSLFNHTGTTVSCATCHGSTVTASSFAGVFPMTMGSLSPAHVPTTAACGSCHVAGAPSGLVPSAGMTTFANAQFSHAGISTGCAACHGPSLSGSSFFGVNPLIVMPPTSPSGSTSHLPTSTTCEDCHAGAKPSGLVAASSSNAVGSSLFRNSPPASATIHNGVVSACSNCHEAGMTWAGMDLSAYARNYSTLQASTTTLYRGFQTRPVSGGGGNSIADAAHPNTSSGDCSLCHGNTTAFGQPSQPPNHIPYG
jgi:predicted CXXCH cytochrome family protein